jgi:hypothetical protein
MSDAASRSSVRVAAAAERELFRARLERLQNLERQIRASAASDTHEEVRAAAVADAIEHLQAAIDALELAARE